MNRFAAICLSAALLACLDTAIAGLSGEPAATWQGPKFE